MYENVGKKIMVIAKILGGLAIGFGFGAWLYFIFNDYRSDNTMGWICLICGVLAYMSTWIIYGFGQLVQDVSDIRELQIAGYSTSKKEDTKNEVKPIFNNSTSTNSGIRKSAGAAQSSGSWKCSCGRENANYISTCCCGKSKTDVE